MPIERIYDIRQLRQPCYQGTEVEVVPRARRRALARMYAPGVVGRGRRGALRVVAALVFWPDPGAPDLEALAERVEQSRSDGMDAFCAAHDAFVDGLVETVHTILEGAS